jgi:hypothetical protein
MKRQSAAMVTKELFLFSVSTRPQNRAIVQPRIDIQRRLHDGPAWPCTGELCPCICRQPPGIISACQRDDLGVAKAIVTVKRITPFRSTPAVPQGRTRESIPSAMVWELPEDESAGRSVP